ncbi:hypothetical protein RVR_3962 [Actinacidiphila reveromycinica]|uniref:Uncharacterized protein n=1 Tax=Actinacidiphila reveromycinica TaxID=659352 RepID=A0A7U3UPF1_9ACTN|nr:hypothetical protein [Streptomyces sp. SN-593]BBA97965.1 hypothetical protein RVR_3962 [Streptomyces sp. SN-593]
MGGQLSLSLGAGLPLGHESPWPGAEPPPYPPGAPVGWCSAGAVEGAAVGAEPFGHDVSSSSAAAADDDGSCAGASLFGGHSLPFGQDVSDGVAADRSAAVVPPSSAVAAPAGEPGSSRPAAAMTAAPTTAVEAAAARNVPRRRGSVGGFVCW